MVKLFIRHEKIESLEKLKDTNLHVRHAITAINQDIYTSFIGLIKGTGKKSGSEKILKNNENSYFLGPIAEDKLPKGIANGHFLSGEISFYKDVAVSKVVCILFSIINSVI